MESILDMLQTFATELKAESLEERRARITKVEKEMVRVAIENQSSIFGALNSVSRGSSIVVTLTASPRPESEESLMRIVGSPPKFEPEINTTEDATKQVASSVYDFA